MATAGVSGMKIRIYGITTCDSVRKVRKWLENKQITYEYIDLVTATPPRSQIQEWINAVGHSALVNKRSTTWKKMSTQDRKETDHGDTISVLIANPKVIKRPVVEYNDQVSIGFNVALLRNQLNLQEPGNN